MYLTIRCHPCVPAASADIEEWLERALAREASASGRRARLLRISQRLPSGREVAGWLVDIEADDEHDLQTLLRDMRLLGLEPTVLKRARGESWLAHPEAPLVP
jgi:hypothetical protein